MKKKFVYILLFFLNFYASNLFAQDVNFKARLDTNQILIGDYLKLNLEVHNFNNEQIQFPIFQDTLINDIELIEQLELDTNENNILTQTYIISVYDSGLYQIPPIPILSGKDTLFSNPLAFYAHNVGGFIDSTKLELNIISTADTSNIYKAGVDTTKQIPLAQNNAIQKTPLTIKEFFAHIKVFFKEYWYIVLILIIIIGVLIWYYYFKKEPEKIIIKKQKPIEPAHIIALRDLNELKERALIEQKKFKLFHTELTDIIRNYIENRYYVSAMEQTSQEILDNFQYSKLMEKEHFEYLKQLLYLADFVKFAKLEPAEHENQLSLKNAFLFVENTKLIEEPIKEEIKENE